MPAIIDMTGRKFGKLTAIRRSLVRVHGHLPWVWLCDCGKQIERMASPITSGRQVSCGCHRDYQSRLRKKHGAWKTKTYRCWIRMKARATGREPQNRRHYFERGITVSPRWLADFSAFLEDMGECPKGMSIERIDNDGPYEPGNCRWATQHDQTRNTRRTVRVVVRGVEMCLKDACFEIGASYDAVRARIRRGMAPQNALGVSP